MKNQTQLHALLREMLYAAKNGRRHTVLSLSRLFEEMAPRASERRENDRAACKLFDVVRDCCVDLLSGNDDRQNPLRKANEQHSRIEAQNLSLLSDHAIATYISWHGGSVRWLAYSENGGPPKALLPIKKESISIARCERYAFSSDAYETDFTHIDFTR